MPTDRLVHHFLSVYAQQQSEGIWSLKEPMVSISRFLASNVSHVLLTDTVCVWNAQCTLHLPCFMPPMVGRGCLCAPRD